MIETMRTVRLYGRLGAEFGRVHRLAVNSTAEAVRALCVLLPGFEAAMAASAGQGVAYACFIGQRSVTEDELIHPVGNNDIRIAPVATGGKRAGLFQTVLGAVLIAAAAIYTGGVSAAFAAKGIAGSAAMIGASLAFGGVVQMLSPQQRALSTRDRPENGASYNFNGPVNTTAQGNPVPILYGRMIVGSATISAGIFSEDQA
ncbi:tail assembly protein [Achromobacter xylosoxidans]|uniref:tail assembly protein n=1 Tax=Alcaligenes xylosoxydans xylosoxydans TaxID=85698 RepID=UPI0012A9A43D|nr:tail assembly protein [Achromobacter xylosoxidans]CUR73924.1 Phage-related protein, tail component [Achromobacter xylosoxidans]